MGTHSLDQNFMRYRVRLSVVEKESLYQVAKHYVELKDDTLPIGIEQYNAEIEEAMESMDSGEFYAHEQVKEMSKGWLNGKSRQVQAAKQRSISGLRIASAQGCILCRRRCNQNTESSAYQQGTTGILDAE